MIQELVPSERLYILLEGKVSLIMKNTKQKFRLLEEQEDPTIVKRKQEEDLLLNPNIMAQLQHKIPPKRSRHRMTKSIDVDL